MSNYEKRIEKIHEILGIPDDYEKISCLTLQVEEIDLVELGEDVYGRTQRIARSALVSWLDMKAQAEKENITLLVVSAFRSVDKQLKIIQKKLEKGEGIDNVLNISAAPGYSEHHTGCALDLTIEGCEPLTEKFDETEAFDWLKENSGKYLFRMSYPKDNKHGIAYEPWHWFYAGE